MLRARLVELEELRILLCKIEAVLNSKPLTYMSDDITDMSPLSPAHFLIGRKLTQLPEIENGEVKQMNLKQFFKTRADLLRAFTVRWRSVYLRELKQHAYTATRLPKIDDVVLVDNDRAPHLWPVGVVEELYLTRGNAIRSARVKMGNKRYTRPINKLYKVDY